MVPNRGEHLIYSFYTTKKLKEKPRCATRRKFARVRVLPTEAYLRLPQRSKTHNFATLSNS